MSKASPHPEKDLKIFSLKIKRKTYPQHVSAKVQNLVADTIDTQQQVLDTGQGYHASVDIFGKNDVPIAGSVLDDGQHFASVNLASAGFTFDDLFSNFASDLKQFFVFDDVSIQLLQKPGESLANIINFTGKLRLDSPLLKLFKDFLKIDDGIVMSASIPIGGQDLTGKVVPTMVKLSSQAQLHLQITDSAVLSAAAMEVTIERELDTEANQIKWIFSPKVSGLITLTNLGTSPVETTAEISFSNGTLSLNASVAAVSGLFGVNNLNLQDFNISCNAGSESSIDLAAKISSISRTLNFQGKITPKNAAMIASAENFTLDDLNDLFRSVSSARLAIPDFDVTFKNVMIGLATSDTTIGSLNIEKGFTVGCSLSVQGHECNATAVISPDGISFEGELGEVTIGPVDINQVKLLMKFNSVASGKASEFALLGSAIIEGVTVDCKVAYEKLGATWNAVVYGALSSSSFGLANIFPTAAGTMLDTLKFSKVAFIFASQDSTTKDPDFSFPVKKGLQLTGTLEEIPALSQLTRSKKAGLQLTALFGSTTTISIALPDTKLQLGNSVTTDPFSIAIQITPQPELDLIFGLNVTVPKQDTPLHFDLKLGVGIVGANGSATMKGFWKDPFGVKGLQIGPELALQLDIIYAQFVSTGTPSGFGFAGGIQLGDIVGKMAVSITEDPTKEILYGEILELSPQNLVKFASTITGLKLQDNAIPDFFKLKQLKLYCAPTGGTIGTITYQQGFSFAADLVLFDKEISIYTSFNADGVVAKGHLDKLEIGPLKIKGEKGQNAELDLELTSFKQSVLIDGAIDFMGSHAGLFVNISKQGIEFTFDENFAGLLEYKVTGKSQGSILNPSTLDFSLIAEFSNAISAYLKDNVSLKIKEALQVTNISIDALQQDLAKKEAAYKALFNPANATLVKAQADAADALAKAQQVVQVERQKWTALVQNAQNSLDSAKAAYDTAFSNATKAVADAQLKYNAAMKSAQDGVTNAQRSYDIAFSNAQNKVNAAKANYDNVFGSAIRNLNNYQNQVNTLQSRINDLNRDLKNLTFLTSYKAPGILAQIATLETAKTGANGFLATARAVVNGFARSTEAIAFNTATAALNVVQTTGEYAGLQAAQKVLQGIQFGVDYAAFQTAQRTLAGIQFSSQYTVWQGAELSLKGAQTTGRAVLTQAEFALANIGTSMAYTAFDIAAKSLDAIKNGSAAISYQQAQAYLEAAKIGAGAILNLSSAIAAHGGDFIDIKRVTLSASLKDIENGKLFSSSIDATVLGKAFNWKLDFNVQDVEAFIKNLFDKAFGEAKNIAVAATKH